MSKNNEFKRENAYMGMWKLLAIVFLVFMILPLTHADSTQQYNKIFLNPFYRETMSLNTNYTYMLTINPPDKINNVLNAIITIHAQINGQSQNMSLRINNQSCNNPSYYIATAFSTTGENNFFFDCSNRITKAGTYNITINSAVNTGVVSAWIDLTYINNPKGTAKISGTDYYAGEKATIFVQLVDSNGIAVDNATCNFDLYNSTNPLMSPIYNKQPMVFRGADGIYYYQFSLSGFPTGVYPIDAACNYVFNEFYYYGEGLQVANITTNAGTFQGGSPINLNSGSDSLYMSWTSTPINITATWDNVTGNNFTTLTFVFLGESDAIRTVAFYAYNWSSGKFISIGTLTTTAGGGNPPTGYNDLFTANIPSNISDFKNSTGAVRIQIYTSGAQRFSINWLQLQGYKNSTIVAEVKGSSEVHVYPLNISDMPQLVWNSSSRTLTDYNSSVIYANTQTIISLLNGLSNLTAAQVWDFSGGRNLTFIDWQTGASFVWNYTERTLTNVTVNATVIINSTEIASAVWNYTNRSLTEFNFPITASTNNTAIALAVWNTTPRTLTDYNLSGISGNQSIIISNQLMMNSTLTSINSNVLQVNTTTQNTYAYLTETIFPFLSAMNSTISGIQSTLNTAANNILIILGSVQMTENTTLQINDTVNLINAKNYTPTIVVNTTVNLTNVTNTYNNTQIFNYTQNVTAVFNVTVDNITNIYNNTQIFNYTENVTVAPVFNVTTQNVTVQNVTVVVNQTDTNNTQVFNYTQNVTAVFNVTVENTTQIYNYTQNVTVSPVFNVTVENVTNTYNYTQNVTVSPVFNVTVDNVTNIYNSTQIFNYTQNVTVSPVFNVTTQNVTVQNVTVVVNQTDINTTNIYNTTQVFNYTQNVTAVFNVTVDNVTNIYNTTQIFNYTNIYNFTENVTVSPVFNVTTQNVTVQNVSVIVNTTNLTFDYSTQAEYVWNHTPTRTLTDYNNSQIYSTVTETNSRVIDMNTTLGYVYTLLQNVNITTTGTYQLLLAVNSTIGSIQSAVSGIQTSINNVLNDLFVLNATVNNIESNTIQINSSIQQIPIQVWNYSNRELTGFNFTINVNSTDIANAVWSASIRTLTDYNLTGIMIYLGDLNTSISNLPSNVWSYTNRSLTEFNFVVNIATNDTAIANAVWSSATRTLTDYNMTGINGAIIDMNGNITEIKNIVQGASNLTADQVWNYTSRELTNYNDTGIYLFLNDINGTVIDNRNLLQGAANLTADQVWNATLRTLTDYNSTGISASVWSYSTRTLTDYNLTQIEGMLADVNATAYRIENNTIEINGTTQNTWNLLYAINGSLVPNTIYIW